ncbi:MAG TPA: SURF1 family protein [Rhodanobacteraceae bacterium]
MRQVVRARVGARGMMGMRKPAWWAVLVTVIGVLIFVRLGIWQLHRAVYKEQLMHLFATSSMQPVVPFAKVEPGVADHDYPHVSVRGHFIQGHEYLLDDQTHANRLGVQVYAPFVVDGADRVLLVDLGFLPRTRTDALPDLPPVKAGELDLEGLYAKPPRAGLKLGGNRLPKEQHWPKLVIYISLGQIGVDLEQRMFPRVLLLDPDPDVAYVRQWVPDTMPPARHRAYAFQWFTFAAAAIAIFVILNRRKPRKKRRNHE